MLRERAAPSCAHVYLLHCKLRALSLLISTKYFSAISLLALFHCIALQTVFSGLELSRFSSKSSQPAWFLGGISCSSVCLTCLLPVGSCGAAEGWHTRSALSKPLNVVQRVLPGAAGQRPLLPAQGTGKVLRAILFSCRFLPHRLPPRGHPLALAFSWKQQIPSAKNSLLPIFCTDDPRKPQPFGSLPRKNCRAVKIKFFSF